MPLACPADSGQGREPHERKPSPRYPPGVHGTRVPALDEDGWEDLLALIEDGKVLPVVGTGITTTAGTEEPIQRWLAGRLALRLGLTVPAGSGELTLNSVVAEYLRARGDVNLVYMRIARLLRDESPLPGEALQLLASIRDFRLFVSMTFDPLLERAIDDERHGGARLTSTIAFSPKSRVIDLPSPARELAAPMVVQLLGRVSTAPDEYAVWEEDLLEFIVALQQRIPATEHLGRELRDRSLLFLGLQFPDWLVRLFLRVSRQGRLSNPGALRAYIADCADDGAAASLVGFLSAVNRDFRVIADEPATFVRELARRWRERNPGGRAHAHGPREALRPGCPDGAIFLSYAREDEHAALAIVEALEQSGCTVWYDRHELRAGQAWEDELRDAVLRRCALFLSVISRTTESTREAYYHRERRWAEERAQGFAPGVEFYVPVVIDDSPLPSRHEPRAFAAVHAEWHIGGRISGGFAERLRDLQQKRAGGAAP